ncbi:cytochrome-c peroxidase [Rhodovulum visakhapatnamense]|uniref:Cytochrome c peroxidase n=2 Tax=Rhodovulum visakhapatnamense TaxID=364297 RepID=A0A4R8GCC5_9RHOB|nr:cytochrome c peroxidase [Rhodovulum visakhapatnamense]TDX33380.1 cytochrome c peroxidase [Rhodovulum visakhapatnamense]
MSARPTAGKALRLGLLFAAAGLALVAMTAPLRLAPEDLRAVYAGPPETWPAPEIDPGVAYVELAPRSLPPRPAPGSAAEARRALGERLFADPVLSASGQIACDSCHNRRLGWGDGLPRSLGHGRQEGPRNAPALFAAGAGLPLFWDGRAATLEAQALGPMANPVEMANADLGTIPPRIAADPAYPPLFEAAFGPGPVTLDRIAAALAAFQTHLDRPTRFDRFLAGDSRALGDLELRGLHLFRTRARCANCHFGPLLSDGAFHDLGLSFLGRGREDLGRYAVTGLPEDAGRFRTPSLRHVARSAPYMHNGIFPHLPGVIRFYAGGGGASARLPAAPGPVETSAATPSPLIRRLDLSPDDIEALAAFLEAI